MASPSPASATEQEKNPSRKQCANYLATYRPLWPCILGLTAARAGLIVASYGSYKLTDEGIFTDGSMLITLAIL
ncbi:MAG: LuxR family transcriptional regulator, partial [Raoultibacter sp.]